MQFLSGAEGGRVFKREEGRKEVMEKRRREEWRKGAGKRVRFGKGESSRFKGSLRTTVYGSFLIGIGTNASLYPGGRILSKSY